MWKNTLKKFLSILVVVFCCLPLVWAQEEDLDLLQFQELAKELSNQSSNSEKEPQHLSQSSKEELQNANDLKRTQTALSLESMSVEELFTNLEEILTQQDLRIKTLLLTSEKSESDLAMLTEECNSLKMSLAQLKEALVSNKDDTSFMIKELGKLLNDIEKLRERVAFAEKRLKNAMIYSEIVTPLPGLMIMTAGVIEMSTGDSVKGLNLIKAGAITLVGMEIVYNGGKFILKIW